MNLQSPLRILTDPHRAFFVSRFADFSGLWILRAIPVTIPVSVFIITMNEAARIGATISAVIEWVDEVIIVDSGSDDDTVKIAQALGAKVCSRKEWSGFGAQKRFGEDQCRNDWLLNIDADEVVQSDLRASIEGRFSDGAEPDLPAWSLRILNVYPGRNRPRLLANDYNVVRLYDRRHCRYRDHPVYDRVDVSKETKIGQLSGAIYHYSLLNWTQMVDKANRHSSHEVARVARKSLIELYVRLAFEFPFQFVRNYIFRRHILGGSSGFIFSLNTAFMRTLRIAKALEQRQVHSRGS